MADHIVPSLNSGTHNLATAENIPSDAAQNAFDWITQDGTIVLIGGRRFLGVEGTQGKVFGLHYGFKVDGTVVLYRRTSTVVQYFDGTVWKDVLTGLTADQEMVFANYSSLAGAFTFIGGSSDGLFKINNANPDEAINMYAVAKNFHGKILIDRARMLLWDRDDEGSQDKTGLYGSHIDPQDSTVYNTISAEAIGSSGSTAYGGTLAFKASGILRNCFGVGFTATVAAGTEVFVDNYDGTLTSNFGGTGTIVYATGVFAITFSDTTTGAVTSDYQFENSNEGGLTDFTKSATRVAGEGFQFPQDVGGDAILNVLVGQDGAYYSMKSESAYRLELDATDLNATNLVYRRNIGIPFFRAAFSTSQGIIFMNTVNPTKPAMTVLRRNVQGDSIEPVELFKHFKFSDFNYDDCSINNYDRYILVMCKTNDEAITENDTILFCDVQKKTVDVVRYEARMSAQDSGDLFVGSPLTQSVQQILNGFDDDGLSIDNEWTGKDERYGKEFLKKFRRLRLKGLIDPDQSYDVFINYDGAGRQLVGTIEGSATYVDFSKPQTIGSNFIGEAQVGGDDVSLAYPYFAELKFKTPKFRTRAVTFVAKGIGFVNINYVMDYDILSFEDRLPKRFRTKLLGALAWVNALNIWNNELRTWDETGGDDTF